MEVPVLWLYCAVGSALFQSANDLLVKRTCRGIDNTILIAGMYLFSAIFLTPFVHLEELRGAGLLFWVTAALCSAISVSGSLLFVSVLSRSEISLVAPLQMLTPLFVLIISAFAFHENPSPAAIAGVLCIALGSIMLSAAPGKKMRIPMFKSRSIQMMIAAAALWSVSLLLSKAGMRSCSPLTWLAVFDGGVLLLLVPWILFHQKAPLRLRASLRTLVIMGLFEALSGSFLMMALESGCAGPVIALKRLSVLITVVLGAMLFSEHNCERRFAAAAVMLIGTVLTAY